jgi:putative endopeptidase
MLVGFVLARAGRLTDRASYDAFLDADNRIRGASGRMPDELVAYGNVRGLLSTPMARAYIDRYDASKVKEQITDICRQVISCYRDMLAEEDWLSATTRRKAVEKLDAITINAVYPDTWVDYSGLDLTGLSFYECMTAIERFYQELDRSHTNGRVDRKLWDGDILDQNAYYFPQDNSINIILGLLEKPFYYDGMSDEELLGGIGAVIGHEISHAFDPTGAQFDKDGNLASWWTAEDHAAFQARAARLVDYFDGISVWDGLNVSGSSVQGEASADMAGLKVMLRIARDRPGFDYQKFFTSYATIWRRIVTRELAYYMTTQDPHPLNYLRTNTTLQQFDEFMDAFGIQPGDAMYLAPEDRVTIW